MKNYIAYGSNLNMSRMFARCPTAEFVGTSKIRGYELLFKGSKSGAYLTIERKRGGSVPVAIWRITPADEEALDIYEGFPDFYYKKAFRLRTEGKMVNAFAYIMHEYRKLAEPSKHYVDVCLGGYLDFGFKPHYIFDAVLKSKQGRGQ